MILAQVGAAELSAMVGLRTGRGPGRADFQSALAALVPHAAATLRDGS